MATLALSIGVGLTAADEAMAHGYVESPPARGYQGSLDKNTMGWTQAYEMYGNVITNPQSLEAPKGFPQAGPADGRIASANGGLGQISDFVLDNTGVNRWKKTDIKSGMNTFTWKYTAPHSTTKWHYYMTKQGWNPDQPLARKDLELIGTVAHDNSAASNNLSHKINVPTDRSGYNVILAVWDVADTPNAFYNVIDVNVKSNGEVLPPVEVAPEKPTNVKASEVTTSSAKLTWNKVNDAKEYNVYRNNQKVGTVGAIQFNDSNLKENTSYSYQVEAVGFNGKISEKSNIVTVKTQSSEVEDNQKPTAPTSVHSMGTTDSSVDLMWGKSTHFLGVKHYEVYRDGKKVATTEKTSFKDTALKANTKYTYTVKAISLGGNASDLSAPFVVTTKPKEEVPSGVREWKLGTFSKPELYTAGEKVQYKGKEYKVTITHNNYGDITWAPGANSLFK
nr:lytic polysaccharide monooxygenase [Enterococcus rivorum]